MSVPPGAMQSMLAQQLMQSPQAGSMGGMQGQISPMNSGASLMQKLMLIRALKGQQPQQPGAQPDPNTIGGVNAIPQQMNQQPLPGGSNA